MGEGDGTRQGAGGAPRVPLGKAHRPLREIVHDQLLRWILSGRYSPGERLFEDHIAAELDVSRNPVREALQALAKDGFVVLEPRRGARVSAVSPAQAADLFEVREALEATVARLAATRRTDEQLAELEKLVAAGRDAIAGGELDLLPDLNTRFHEVLAESSANVLLAETLARLAHLIEWVYAVTEHDRRSTRSWSEHAAIVEAVAARDPDAATAAATRHIANARAAFFGR